MKKLELVNLSIGYDIPLVNSISASLSQGEITLLIGKNGSGKTTLIKTLFNEVPYLKGKISINHNELTKENFYHHLSVVLSNTSINSEMTVLDVLELGRFPYKKWYEKVNHDEKKWMNKILELTNLKKYKHLSINKLSDGNLQKTFIARALVQNTDFIVLDEPTTHLDLENKLMILDLLKTFAKEYNKGILFTSHDWQFAFSIADNLWCIDNQQFISGNLEDVAIQLKLFESISTHQFNYSENKFIEKSNHIKRKVSLLLDDEKYDYWLKHALIKHNFEVVENSSLMIKIIDDKYVVFNNDNMIFETYTISQLLELLKTIQF
jgi:iron complex transport system ATP-binding protein